MLWAYDLQFWTLQHASKDFGVSINKIGLRYVYPMQNEGYIVKYFDKLTPSNTREDHLFRDELKFNYRVRYALSQKGRLLAQRFYREFEPICPDLDTSYDSSLTPYDLTSDT